MRYCRGEYLPSPFYDHFLCQFGKHVQDPAFYKDNWHSYFAALTHKNAKFDKNLRCNAYQNSTNSRPSLISN